MKILFLTPQLPYPPYQGAALRNLNMIKALSEKHEIHLLSFGLEEDKDRSLSELQQYCHLVEVVPPPKRSLKHRIIQNISSKLPDIAFRLYSEQFRNKLFVLQEFEEYDAVQIEAIEMASYGFLLKKRSGPKCPKLIYDAHNVEWFLQKRLAEKGRGIGKVYSMLQKSKLIAFERNICRIASKVLCVSSYDRQNLQKLDNSIDFEIIPNAIDIRQYHPEQSTSRKNILFIGKLDYRPNAEALSWFVRKILPQIHQPLRGIELQVIGSNPRGSYLNRPGIQMLGQIKEVHRYLQSSSVLIAPFLSGSGSRFKILEAMASGVPTVATAIGIEGIDALPGRDYLLANDPDEFAEAVIQLINTPDLANQIRENALKLVKGKYDWNIGQEKLKQIYEKL